MLRNVHLEVLARQDEEELGGVMEGEDAARRERFGVPGLIEGLLDQKPNERQALDGVVRERTSGDGGAPGVRVTSCLRNCPPQ